MERRTGESSQGAHRSPSSPSSQPAVSMSHPRASGRSHEGRMVGLPHCSASRCLLWRRPRSRCTLEAVPGSGTAATCQNLGSSSGTHRFQHGWKTASLSDIQLLLLGHAKRRLHSQRGDYTAWMKGRATIGFRDPSADYSHSQSPPASPGVTSLAQQDSGESKLICHAPIPLLCKLVLV